MSTTFEVALHGHTVNILPPQSISGGKLAQCFTMAGADHVSIILSFGAVPSPPVSPTAIIVNQCTDAAGSNPLALPTFRFYYQTLGGAGNDILNGVLYVPAPYDTPPNYSGVSEGITQFPSSLANLVYVIELNAADLETPLGVGTVTERPYVQLQIVDGGNATYASAIAVLSGMRNAYNIGQSVTV